MTRAAAALASACTSEPGGKGVEQPGSAAAAHPHLAPPRRRRTGRHPLGSRQSARVRAAALARLLIALAANRGPRVTITVTSSDGRAHRARFCHPSIVTGLRRAIAEARAVNAAHGHPPPAGDVPATSAPAPLALAQ